jgi:ribosomal protection tetracycline resistance protein
MMRTLNIGILAHVDAGKTTLTERLLFEAGVIDEPGSVDDGSSHTDTMELERRRGITIRAAVVSFDVDGTTLNLFDTPGHSDFIGEVERALLLLDGAVLVVSAVDGVQAQTVLLMRTLQRLHIATVVFVNKADIGVADPELVELEIRDRLDSDVPVLAGSARTGEGVTELLHALPSLLPVREIPPEGAPSGVVFKIDWDDAGRKEAVTFLRGGTLRVRDRVAPAGGDPETVTGMRVYRDGETLRVAAAYGGQVVAVHGLESARVGDEFGDAKTSVVGGSEPFPRPSLATVVEPFHEADRPALFTALDRLIEQDPLIGLRVDDESRELRLTLYGEVQQQVIGALLEDQYGVAVRFRETVPICIERLLGEANVVALIGSDTNPYLATLGLRVGRAPAGSGVNFGLDVEQGALPAAFFRAIEGAARNALAKGNHGWDIPDAVVRVTRCGYLARQSHSHATFDKSMSSTAGDFRGLTRLLMKRAVSQARTQVCEPVHTFVMEVPSPSLGQSLSLLARVGGAPLMTQPRGPAVVVTGEVPAAGVQCLARNLAGATRGEGILSTRLDHHRPDMGL